MKIRLLENDAMIYEEAEKSSAVKTALKTGDVLYAQRENGRGTEGWLKVRNEAGIAGFMPASIKVEQVTVERFRIERAAFIAIAATSVASFLQLGGGDFTALGRWAATFGVVAFMMGAFFVAAHAVLGFPWANFFEQINEEALPIPAWDWRRFVIEPLYWLIAVAGVFAFVGLSMLYRRLTGRDQPH